MSSNSFKPLHVAHSLEELKTISNVKIPPNLNPTKCHERMKLLNTKAVEANKLKDQEYEFLHLHRYLLFLARASKDIRVSRKDALWKKEFQNALAAEKRYTELTDNLKSRYKSVSLESKQSCITIYPADGSTETNGRPKNPNPEIHKPTNNPKVTEKAEKEREINCYDLHKLITGNPVKQSFLIIDVRPPGDFEDSHISHRNVLKISSDNILIGMSANSLGKIFTDKDSQNLWKMRGDVDKLVLLDWSSSFTTLENKAPLNHLLQILEKWDQRVNYKCCPLVLEGGYEELISRYPHITTNPNAKIPIKDISSNNNSILTSFDYPMEELEPEKENIAKDNNRKQLIVDRSSKPQLQQKPKKISSITKESTKAEYEDIGSDVSVFSSSDVESSQPINSLNLTEKTVKSTQIVNKDDSVKMNRDHSEPISKPPLQDENVLPEKENTLKHDVDYHETFNTDMKPNSPLALNDPAVTPNPQRQLNELRKRKPQLSSSGSTHGSPKDSFKNRDDLWDSEEGIFSSPLKRDGGGSGGLKRSSSSPNIAQMKDDDSFHVKHPTFTRANKPNRIRQPTYGERTDSTYGTTSAGLTGLKNFANNCYMNSILQCLSNTEQLVKEMTALNKPTLNNHSRSKGRVAQEVIDAFRNMWSGETRVYSIKDLKTTMGNIKDIFKGTAHQDSNEFLIILLEHLHEDLNKPAEVTLLDGADIDSGERAWGEFRRKNCSVIQRLFYGQHKSTVTCGTCDHASATFEQFFNLFVPIPTSQSGVTLNDCIQLYMSGERISGWKCPKCKTERNATKKFDISRLPPILVIALKRFTQEDDSWLQKKEDIVYYPLQDLDMSKFTVAGSEQRYTRYNLYAMSIHSGTLKSGHYRAICKNYKNQKWYLFDDQSVEPLPVHSVKNNPEVYILFYNAVAH